MISSEMVPSGVVPADSFALENAATRNNQNSPVDSFYTRQEDIANSLTHALGILLSLVGLLYLLMQIDHLYTAIAITIYGSSSILLYSASTAYHFVQRTAIKKRLRQLDHGSIYLLIAGSYTPYLMLGMSSKRGLFILAAVWSVALLGVAFKLFVPNPYRYEKCSLASYVGLGWAILFVIPEMVHNISPSAIAWLVFGGFSYMVGILFFKWNALPYNHAIWHLFVLGGTVCHFLSILTIVVPF